ncbi:hypothetical protein HOD08_04950 [bacterium]|nr:hypothetical protein [bacterium]
MFKVDETVVYPGHGVARIDDVSEKIVAGNIVSFYKLSFLYKDMTVLIPLNSMRASGVRYLSEPTIVRKALATLEEEINIARMCEFSASGWNKRQKEYMMKIQSGKLIDLAKAYRDLMSVSLKKELSFGERGILSTIEELFAQEIITARGMVREEVLRMIKKPFVQSEDPHEMPPPTTQFTL